jgi:hypothetical protein
MLQLRKIHRHYNQCSQPAGSKYTIITYPFLSLVLLISNAGNRIRLVKVATTRVREVSQPRAWVLPKPLKQNIIKPAINTREV